MTVTPRFTGFIGTPNGERRVVEGEQWADDDPFVVANPHAFTDPEPRPEPEPEPEPTADPAPNPARASTRRATK